MFNFGQVVSTVQRNCHISDAQYAGDYTLCVFLLKMREYYRWEHQIPFTGQLPREDVGRWMQERELAWEQLESTSFEPLVIGNRRFDPFDADDINRHLIPQGYIYSAGYGRFGKPHFFLGNLQRQEQREGVTIHISSCEYARDLVAPPAMLLDGNIFLRQESLRRYIWERAEEWLWNRGNDAMQRAIAAYDFEKDRESALDRMTEAETESVILHELGEARADRLLGEPWPRMLAALSRSTAEIQARAVRDILADCLSTLPALIEADRRSALHFYFANFGGMRRHLFPEAVQAYQRWVDGEDQALAQLLATSTARWLDMAQTLIALHQRHDGEAGRHIEALLEHPPACQILAAH